MKKNLSLIALLCSFLLMNTARAAETEPNNTSATANTLALNGSNSGKIALSGDQDWWQVATTGDGKLSVTLTPLSGRNTYAQIYDNNGTLLFVSNYSTTAFTVNQDGLTAGTYKIKVICYYATDSSSYIISNLLTQPAQANDVEPNGTRALAKVLPLNGTRTGHIGYYYNNLDDTLDWYKVTTTLDGKLEWTITSHNGNNVYAQLFDNDGTTLFAGSYTTGTATYSQDGLSAGVYYLRIKTYYNNEFAPYTISNNLVLPAVVNDVEPNGTPAQALTLAVGDSLTGHIGYYYNHLDDTTDWYKVTTAFDGRLDFTMTSYNGQNVYLQLYDNDGTTFLEGNYTTGTATYSKDGLAAGTYYLRVRTYYNSEFAPYKVKVKLVQPAQANDTEPNGTRALALNLPVNGSTTGHANYYYNLLRDAEDWYKVTTSLDGMLSLTITSHNGQNVWVYLYDNNGTTQLDANYSTTATTIKEDGLAPGTYYVKIRTYYTTEFVPYTLSNTLTTYTYTNDTEPNGFYSQAKTIPANGSVTGHVNFYYNGARPDAEDKWRINYTGTGNMTLVFDQENRKEAGTAAPTYIRVYKDTAGTPIYSNYFSGPSGNINLTGLTQGYYYVKINTYYSSDFSAYRISTTFTQVNVVTLKLTGSTASATCDSTNSLTFKCTGSSAPYTVQMTRNGVQYGATRIIRNSQAFTYTNLPPGVYRVVAYGDGATGAAFSAKTVTFVPIPTSLTVSNILATQVRLNWNAQSCVKYYSIQWRPIGTTTWTTKKTVGNVATYIAKPLTASTTYEWHIAPVDSANGVIGQAAYSVLDTFTTAAAFALANGGASADEGITKANGGTLSVYPNPARTQFTVQFNAAKTTGIVSLWLKNLNGAVVWNKNNIAATAARGTQVDVSRLPAGIYLLHITDQNNNTIATHKVVVAK